MFLLFFLLTAPLVTSIERITLTKYEELSQMARKTPYITLDPTSFKYFTEGLDRNYSLIVYFKLRGYNLPSFFYHLDENFQKIALSASKPVNAHIDNVFFAKVFDNDLTGKYCTRFKFNKMPVIVHFSPSGILHRRDLYDVRMNDGSVDSLSFWVLARTSSKIVVVKQLSMVKLLVFGLIVVACGGIYYFFGKSLQAINVLPFWSISLIGFTSLVQGGLMYVLISGSPMFGGNRDKIEFVSPGMRGQYGSEVILVATLYCLISYSLVKLDSVSAKKLKLKPLVVYLGALVGSIFLIKQLMHFKAPWLFD